MTAADRPYGKFYDFYSVSLETFGSTHVCLHDFDRDKFTFNYRVDGFQELISSCERKIKITVEQDMKAQRRGGRVIAVLFL